MIESESANVYQFFFYALPVVLVAIIAIFQTLVMAFLLSDVVKHITPTKEQQDER
jgi:hypothetical protein